MAGRRGRFAAKTRVVYRQAKSKYRRPKRNDLKRVAKKAAIGGAAGIAISGVLTYAAKRTNQPVLQEVGQRVGSIASTYLGGTAGNTAFQVADAAMDRFVNVPGVGNISGGSQVYL